MGKQYSQLAMDERCEIFRLHAGGASLRGIGRQLGRSGATVSRTIRGFCIISFTPTTIPSTHNWASRQRGLTLERFRLIPTAINYDTFARRRCVRVAMRSGAAMSAFQASQQASTISS